MSGPYCHSCSVPMRFVRAETMISTAVRFGSAAEPRHAECLAHIFVCNSCKYEHRLIVKYLTAVQTDCDVVVLK
jgi:hypothetical protein